MRTALSLELEPGEVKHNTVHNNFEPIVATVLRVKI